MKGVPVELVVTEDEVKQKLMENFGNIKNSAKELGIGHAALYKYLERKPHIKEYQIECYKMYVECRKDTAESVLDKLMDRVDKDPRHAYYSATYILNNTGQDRSFNHPKAMDNGFNKEFALFESQMKSAFQEIKNEAVTKADNSV